MNRAQAIARLRQTRELSTKLLEPLGINFETFLRFAQLSDERQQELMDQLIAKYEGAKP